MTERTIRRAERRAKAIDLIGESCVRCGSTDNLHFDHISNDRLDLNHRVSALLGGGWGWKNIIREVSKCQLLCIYCHASKTAKEDRKYPTKRHGKPSMYNNYKCRCQECRSAWTLYLRSYKMKVKGI